MRKVLDYVWQHLRLITVFDIIDIILVAAIIFYILKLVRGTTAEYLLKGVLVLFAALLVSGILKLNIINYLLTSVFQIGILAIVILFQPELRNILHKFGTTHHLKLFRSQEKEDNRAIRLAIANIVDACRAMSADKIGALMVFQREDNVTSVANSGTAIDAETSAELIKNIFYPKSPLHDGAVIVTDGRIRAAGCILPLSANLNISKELGTRHRAALGMSEAYDSISVVVSEENGYISLASGGVLKRRLSPESLEKILCDQLLPKNDVEQKNTILDWMKGWKKK
ncbi:MAG: diadenylate cyclase CdaA [Clostridia bacterium]|nr:diadenylate cyclase CdaA [Clostridia bacterium]